MRKIAVLSDTFPKYFVPHQTQPTIGTAASLHVVASIQTANKPQEFTGVRPELNAIFKEPLELKDGYITMPTGPGLGLEIDTDQMKAFAL
jgi:L-alanine-DL-glutamate epimerase-like enolase superfamily enzyme